MRTSEAFGLGGVFLDADCPDLYAPKVMRASMGGVLRMPHERVADMHKTVAMLRESGVVVYAAAVTRDAVPLRDVQWRSSAAVLIGNEGAGLAQELVDCCDAACVIPMAGSAQSLNAAAAAAVFMWEMTHV
jgi:TrmH family RNA methyltransferase